MTQTTDLFNYYDELAKNVVIPQIKKHWKTDKVVGTPNKDRLDIEWTATTTDNQEKYYSCEVKRREGEYTYNNFVNAQEHYEYLDLNPKREKFYQILREGIFINDKKINSLMERRIGKNGEPRTAVYCVPFPDGYTCFWEINENTHYNLCSPRYYDKYNVNRGEKEWQQNKGLLIRDAVYTIRPESEYQRMMDEVKKELIQTRLIETCVDYQTKKFKQQINKDDIIQDTWAWILQYNPEKLYDAWQKKHLNALITAYLTRQLFSKNSPYYRTYLKFDQTTDEIDYSSDDDKEEEAYEG